MQCGIYKKKVLKPCLMACMDCMACTLNDTMCKSIFVCLIPIVCNELRVAPEGGGAPWGGGGGRVEVLEVLELLPGVVGCLF